MKRISISFDDPSNGKGVKEAQIELTKEEEDALIERFYEKHGNNFELSPVIDPFYDEEEKSEREIQLERIRLYNLVRAGYFAALEEGDKEWIDYYLALMNDEVEDEERWKEQEIEFMKEVFKRGRRYYGFD